MAEDTGKKPEKVQESVKTNDSLVKNIDAGIAQDSRISTVRNTLPPPVVPDTGKTNKD